MNESRDIDRNSLATFIEYAATEKVASSEWNRFMVNHYKDTVMENARRECIRTLLDYGETPPSSIESKNKLYAIAKELRYAT